MFQCPALREYINFEGIKLYGRLREQWDKTTNGALRRHRA